MATDNIIPVDLSQKCDNSAAESQQNSVESLGYHSGKDELTELLCDEDISQVSPPKQVREPLEDFCYPSSETLLLTTGDESVIEFCCCFFFSY